MNNISKESYLKRVHKSTEDDHMDRISNWLTGFVEENNWDEVNALKLVKEGRDLSLPHNSIINIDGVAYRIQDGPG